MESLERTQDYTYDPELDKTDSDVDDVNPYPEIDQTDYFENEEPGDSGEPLEGASDRPVDFPTDANIEDPVDELKPQEAETKVGEMESVPDEADNTVEKESLPDTERVKPDGIPFPDNESSAAEDDAESKLDVPTEVTGPEVADLDESPKDEQSDYLEKVTEESTDTKVEITEDIGRVATGGADKNETETAERAEASGDKEEQDEVEPLPREVLEGYSRIDLLNYGGPVPVDIVREKLGSYNDESHLNFWVTSAIGQRIDHPNESPPDLPEGISDETIVNWNTETDVARHTVYVQTLDELRHVMEYSHQAAPGGPYEIDEKSQKYIDDTIEHEGDHVEAAIRGGAKVENIVYGVNYYNSAVGALSYTPFNVSTMVGPLIAFASHVGRPASPSSDHGGADIQVLQKLTYKDINDLGIRIEAHNAAFPDNQLLLPRSYKPNTGDETNGN